MSKDIFIEMLNYLKIPNIEQKLVLLDKYYNLLIEENKKINLTGITDYDQVYLKHFYDSLTITKIINLNEIETICDIGSGAGFPGIVVKIMYPDLKVTLVDSLNKRINFLNMIISELNLTEITTINNRAEEFALNNRDKYDLVVARAVAPLNILLEYTIPITKINGCFIAMKGSNEEISLSNNALTALNCKIEKIEKFKLPIENSDRTLIKISKITKTNNKYPRKYADIKKKPL